MSLILKLNEVKKNANELGAYWFLIPSLVARLSFSRSPSGARSCSRMGRRQSKDNTHTHAHTHTHQWIKKGMLEMTHGHVDRE